MTQDCSNSRCCHTWKKANQLKQTEMSECKQDWVVMFKVKQEFGGHGRDFRDRRLSRLREKRKNSRLREFPFCKLKNKRVSDRPMCVHNTEQMCTWRKAGIVWLCFNKTEGKNTSWTSKVRIKMKMQCTVRTWTGPHFHYEDLRDTIQRLQQELIQDQDQYLYTEHYKVEEKSRNKIICAPPVHPDLIKVSGRKWIQYVGRTFIARRWPTLTEPSGK